MMFRVACLTLGVLAVTDAFLVRAVWFCSLTKGMDISSYSNGIRLPIRGVWVAADAVVLGAVVAGT